jgi:hypothetical protein
VSARQLEAQIWIVTQQIVAHNPVVGIFLVPGHTVVLGHVSGHQVKVMTKVPHQTKEKLKKN